MARKALRSRGIIVLRSTYAYDIRVNFSSLVVDAITLVGSRCGRFVPAVHLLGNKQVDPAISIESRYLMQDAVKALENAQHPGSLKVLFDISPTQSAELTDYLNHGLTQTLTPDRT
jgi:threonine dehydrogenase-like Zn-dependent dehydrogenase